MGKLDAFEVGEKKLTIQTEFFSRPSWRVETKVYLGGALKKVFSDDLTATSETDLQQAVNSFHDSKIRELLDSLKNKRQ